MINIEVAFATNKLQKIIALEINDDCLISDAIKLSGIQAFFHEYDLSTLAVGIFGNRKFEPADYKLQNGDRIEIYRPLLKTPNQKRLDRANHK